ncbi:serine/threonine-protein kinase [Streptomyces sp. NPDC053427]|uniref:serine/threonine-protein kinase n=1 Tax=Streptomyces sp. NPDC053427 TaxID=3365701 RepID=UPI0037D01315
MRGADEPGEPSGTGGEAAPAPGNGAPAAASRSGPERGTDADLTGRVLGGRYRVTGRLGRGGMGVVCRAVDEVLGREVAVKVLRAYTDASAPELADLRTRMQREARAAARIRHSGVVTVHDVIDEDGRPVIVMELVDGPSLDDAIQQQGALDPREIARIGAQVMDALDAAHQVGVLHRDVKPGNVLLDRTGRVVLTDFGIASIEAPGDGATTNITRSGELVGSLDYLPPERAQGQDPTPASDIWSLGMTLYAAVEGSGAPFRRTSVWSTLTAIVTEPLPEPQRAGPLTPVLHALMAKNPADRPSAAEARSLLTAVAEGREPAGVPMPGAPHLPTATDIRPVAPPPPPQEFGQAAAGQGGAAPAGPAPVAPVNSAAPPASWLSGGPGSPAAAGHPAPPEAATPVSAISPGFDPPGVVSGPAVGSTGIHPHLPNPSDGDTERLPARRRRRMLLAVAAVLAVLATGGGVTYALVGGGPSDTVAHDGRQSAAPAGKPTPAADPNPDGSKKPGKGDGKGREKGAGASPSASRGPSGTPTGKNPKPGAPGGSSGGQSGGGKTDGGGTDGGSGGLFGGASGTSGGTSGGGSGNGGSGSGGSGGGEPTPQTSCVSIGGGKTNCDVWRAATSYTASFQQAGTLNAGTNYFYCQAKLGRRETYGKWTNVWWAKTDDDNGNTGVYISVVYLTGGENDKPVPGLPTC